MKSVLRASLIVSLLLWLPYHVYAEPSDDNKKIIDPAADPLTEIIIHGAPFDVPLQDLTGSARVVPAHEIEERSLTTLPQLITSIPGLQWAGGTSTPRFFQIRGIGELDQFQGAPNPSVGVIIDDIDYSGIGALVPLFDIKQVEVLKGPQGIRYGSSALAGVVNMQSNSPSSERDGILELRHGSDDLASGALAVGGAVPGTRDKVQLRISSAHSHQDGFRDNVFLNRDDTNERDMHMTRIRVHADPASDFDIDLTGLSVDNNNGFDAFAIDNSLKTQTDKPGADQLESRAGSLALKYSLGPDTALKSITSYAGTNIDYQYDGDMGNNFFWEPFSPYDFNSTTDRTRATFSQEFNFIRQAPDFEHDSQWKQSGGLFLQRLNEQTEIMDFANEQSFAGIDSDYNARTGAVFGEVGMPLDHGRSLELGARFERRDMRYRDNRPSFFAPLNTMWASRLALRQDLSDSVQTYWQFSRGFKGGGFNPGTRVPSEKRIYDPESQWNIELGLKGSLFSHALNFDGSIFHALRRNAQLKFAFQEDATDPLAFTYVTDSGSRGQSTGIEMNMRWALSSQLEMFLNGMVMESEYTTTPSDLSSLRGRSYSNAPHWQSAGGAILNFSDGLFIQGDVSRQGAVFFDDSHNEKSTPFSLLNLSAGIKRSGWTWTVWWKNVLDENYPIRGFSFGNEPPDFPTKKYVQRGDPSFLGTTLTLSF